MTVGRHLIITGRVQGVFFRAWTKEQADALGVGGWVRNRRDGSVEALIVGTPREVDALVTRLRRGPPAARVDSLEIREVEEPLKSFFEIRHDAASNG